MRVMFPLGQRSALRELLFLHSTISMYFHYFYKKKQSYLLSASKFGKEKLVKLGTNVWKQINWEKRSSYIFVV